MGWDEKIKIKAKLITIRSILIAVLWNIWLERNIRIFKNTQLNVLELCI